MQIFKTSGPSITVLYNNIAIPLFKPRNVNYFRINERNRNCRQLKKLLVKSEVIIIAINGEKEANSLLKVTEKVMTTDCLCLGIMNTSDKYLLKNVTLDSIMLVDNPNNLEVELGKTIKFIKNTPNENGLIEVYFEDIKSILKNSGNFIIESANASGEERGIKAGKSLMQQIKKNSKGSINGGLLNITGGLDFSLAEVSEATEKIMELSEDIIFGTTIKANKKDLEASMLATFR